MEKKKLWWIIGLLILIYCLSMFNYSNLNDPYFNENSSWLAAIDLALYTALLMIGPFIWRLINKKKFDSTKGKKICRWNSVIVFILSFAIGGIGWLPAIVFYFINKWSFVDENLSSNEHAVKCNNCGHIGKKGSEYCTNCSFPLVDINNENIEEIKGAKETEEKLEELNTDENNLSALYNQGVLNVQLRKYETATKDLKKYIKEVEKLKKESEENWYTFNNCVELYIYVKENEEDSKNIVDVNYQMSNAYLHLSTINFEKGEYDSAIKNINKSLKWNPNNINALFEKAENYKMKGELKKYYSLTLDLWDKIYTLKDLAHYYRNLGYYFIEKKEWDLAKTLYLYSVRFENNSVALTELKYILATSKEKTLPAKEDLEDILKGNRIPTYISKNIIKYIKELTDNIIKEKSEGSEVGKFLIELNTTIQDNNI